MAVVGRVGRGVTRDCDTSGGSSQGSGHTHLTWTCKTHARTRDTAARVVDPCNESCAEGMHSPQSDNPRTFAALPTL
eukprot:72460-Prymnesium_polylepis.1